MNFYVFVNQQEIVLCSSLQFYCVASMGNWKDCKQSLDAKQVHAIYTYKILTFNM